MNRWRSFSDWSLKWKFFFVFVWLVTIPLVSGILTYSQARYAFERQAAVTAEGHLDKIEENITAAIRDIEDISSYMIYSEEIREFLMFPNPSDDQIRLGELERSLYGFFVFHLMSKFYMHSITLEGSGGHVIHMGENLKRAEEGGWREKAREAEGRIIWSDAYESRDMWNRPARVVSLFRVINDINDVNRSIGIVTIRLNVSELYELVETDVFRDTGVVFMLGRDGNVVLHGDRRLAGRRYPDEEFLRKIRQTEGAPATFSHSREDRHDIVATRPIEGTDWVLVSAVNKQKVAGHLAGMIRLIRNTVILSALFGLFAMLVFYRFHIRPILELTRQTYRLELGDFNAQVSVRSRDELGKLGLRFNRMVSRLQQLIDNEYKMEIRRREAELKALQSQINPHFLYNTLDMIRWTARLEKAMETGRLIEQLSRIFRMSLNNGKVWIRLQDELLYNRSYLELQQKRLGPHFRFRLLADHDVLQALVFRQMIQPLIENSIQHGFHGAQKPWELYVRCYRKEEQLVIDVIDNGVGFASRDLREMKQHGYALNNINERLQIAFGQAANLKIVKQQGPGAWVQIGMPFTTSRSELGNISERTGKEHGHQALDRG